MNKLMDYEIRCWLWLDAAYIIIHNYRLFAGWSIADEYTVDRLVDPDRLAKRLLRWAREDEV